MSEAELHVLLARLDGGIRNKAARGELRRGLPVGLVWGEGDGEIRLHPDEAISGAIRRSSSASPSSARSVVWLWMRREGVQFPFQRFPRRRSSGSRRATTISTRCQPRLRGRLHVRQDAPRALRRRARPPRQRIRHLPRAEWEVLICDHHPGFIDRETFRPTSERIARNTRPRAHQAGGAVREGAALLQGLASAAAAGAISRSTTTAGADTRRPAYHCPGSVLVEGRGSGASGSAACRSTRPSPARCWPRSRPPASRPRCARPRRWKPTTTRRSNSGGCRSSAPGTRPSAPSAATARSSPSTGSSRAASSATGSSAHGARQRRGRARPARAQRPRTLTRRRARAAARARRRPRPRLVGADDHRPRPQGAAARLIEEVVLDVDARAAPRDAHAALARRRDHRARGAAPAPSADDPHRRGHDRAARAARRPLRRRHERRDPQPPRPPSATGD